MYLNPCKWRTLPSLVSFKGVISRAGSAKLITILPRSLAKGEVGIREKKSVPTLADFITQRFEPWAEASTSSKTWLDYYRPGIRTIQAYKPLANLCLNEITSEKGADFAAWRRAAGRQVSSVNSSLQVLRRVMRLAAQWGAIETAPLIKMLPRERHREHVVKSEEEARYLAAAPEPLASVAAILVDTGVRPDECYRLRWESLTWTNGRNGTILVTHGKTTAARRVLPLTLRARNILQSRWEAAGSPAEGWVWAAPTRSGHFEKSTIKKQHKKALMLSRVRPGRKPSTDAAEPTTPCRLSSLKRQIAAFQAAFIPTA